MSKFPGKWSTRKRSLVRRSVGFEEPRKAALTSGDTARPRLAGPAGIREVKKLYG